MLSTACGMRRRKRPGLRSTVWSWTAVRPFVRVTVFFAPIGVPGHSGDTASGGPGNVYRSFFSAMAIGLPCCVERCDSRFALARPLLTPLRPPRRDRVAHWRDVPPVMRRHPFDDESRARRIRRVAAGVGDGHEPIEGELRHAAREPREAVVRSREVHEPGRALAHADPGPRPREDALELRGILGRIVGVAKPASTRRCRVAVYSSAEFWTWMTMPPSA